MRVEEVTESNDASSNDQQNPYKPWSQDIDDAWGPRHVCRIPLQLNKEFNFYSTTWKDIEIEMNIIANSLPFIKDWWCMTTMPKLATSITNIQKKWFLSCNTTILVVEQIIWCDTT